MTATEMNAARAKKMNGGIKVLAAGMLALAGAGCATVSAPEGEAVSPVTPQARALVEANRRYPRWADFPAAPADLPTPAQFAVRVEALGATAEALAAEAARIPWTLEDPEGFAESVGARVRAADLSPLTAATQAEVEAFAESLRRRATAPPPIDRHR